MEITRFKYFYPEKPRLMSPQQTLLKDLGTHKDWIAEKKYNDQRLMLHMINKKVEFWNRHGEELKYTPTKELLEILEAIQNLKLRGYTLFDGGLRHNKSKGIQHKIILWDVFIWNGQLLNRKPYWYRREILETLFTVEEEPIGITKQYPCRFDKLFKKVISDDEIEGLVMKNKKGKLELGRKRAVNSKWMWKVRKPSGRYRF